VNAIEELLKKDRDAGVPEPPEAAYTRAVLKRRLGRPPAMATSGPADDVERRLVIGAGATALGAALVALLLGASPWWLLAVPVSALALSPILLRRGVR
jgi:hypothetical protein